MNALQHIIFGVSFAIIGCEQKGEPIVNSQQIALSDTNTTSSLFSGNINPDTSFRNIYDFMKVVIADQKLDLSYGLKPEPDLSESDSAFLISLLKETKKEQTKIDTGDWRNIHITFGQFLKCLTKQDIEVMLNQKKQLSSIKWDNSRFGFNLSNDSIRYVFSIPLFSKDKTKAVMVIRCFCPFLCGQGWEVLYSKENKRWTSQRGKQWFY